jgi:DNA-directed RNA polymerase specialized sigma24 family protein
MSALSDSAEDRTMAPSHSVTLWLRQLKQGDRQAVGPLWERYFTRLVHLARNRFPRTAATGAASAEDAALKAFASFCRRAEEDGFARLSDRDDLWQLLVVLAFRKRCNQIQHEQRQRRCPTGGRVYAASALEQDGGEEGALVTNLLSREPEPAVVLQAAEEYRRLLEMLPNAELRNIAVWKLEGYTNEEIAPRLNDGEGRSLSTVERKLARIRRLWEKELTP